MGDRPYESCGTAVFIAEGSVCKSKGGARAVDEPKGAFKAGAGSLEFSIGGQVV